MKNHITRVSLAFATMLILSVTTSHSQSAVKPTIAKLVNGVQKITVVVGMGKYSPSAIQVRKGKPVEITFKGGVRIGCGRTVLFKSLKKSVSVETGKTAVVKFTPKAAGEIKFACSMDMYVGKVIVK